MPDKSVWVAPKLFLTHRGVRVYHTYKDDELENGPSPYILTTDPLNELPYDERASNQIDVRSLDVPSRKVLDGHPPYLTDTDERFRKATPTQRKKWKKQWADWQATGEVEAIRHVVKEAIELGIIQAPATD